MRYAELLKTATWWKKTQLVKARDGFRCTLCESKNCLSVHHVEYLGRFPEDTPIEKLRTVCQQCHDVIHYFWKYTMKYPNEMVYKKLNEVIVGGTMRMDLCEFIFNYPITDFDLKEY